MAELDQQHDQLGHPPSWIKHATSFAIRRGRPVQFGGWQSWIEHATSSAVRRAGPVQFDGWPSWTEHTTSSAIYRAAVKKSTWKDKHGLEAAKPKRLLLVMHVLLKGGQSTPSSSADGQAGSTTRPARPSAKLDQKRDQLGGWSSWIEHATSSAIHQAGPVQFVGWPSWIDNTTSSAIRRAEPVQLGRWPSWIEHATSLAIHRGGLVQFGGWPRWIEQLGHPPPSREEEHLERQARPRGSQAETPAPRYGRNKVNGQGAGNGFTPYHDALVISLTVENCLVKKILEDNGSSGYIIFHAAYKDPGLEESALTRRITPLIWFSGEVKQTAEECPATLEEPQSEEISAIEEDETWMTPLVRYLENDILSEDRKEARKIKKQAARYCISQEVLEAKESRKMDLGIRQAVQLAKWASWADHTV
ncbi:hypothetical protein F2Q69_00006560 [Brassica cretica]|uniref:Uncharacterized protein n=1 Tax=Brassica cretica TaxID=69181 RepID=A0A8S9PL51_BRACR|nr:hypothetical protein F2Q69_00006560 [Brassica cretica]